MITEAKLTVKGLRARTVSVEMERPVQTSGGEIPIAPLVLIDLETEEGASGRAYVFSYTTFALEPLRRLVENLGAVKPVSTKTGAGLRWVKVPESDRAE
jgi:mandelate racemase